MSDLRAAAERLINPEKADSFRFSSRDDAQALARAYLATTREDDGEAVRAMVLVWEPQCGHSIWCDYAGFHDETTGDELPRTKEEMIADLKQGVIEGRYVGWRLMRIERDVLGICD
jgi:hypothetical protein